MREFTETLETILKEALGYIQLLLATGGTREELTNTDDT